MTWMNEEFMISSIYITDGDTELKRSFCDFYNLAPHKKTKTRTDMNHDSQIWLNIKNMWELFKIYALSGAHYKLVWSE